MKIGNELKFNANFILFERDEQDTALILAWLNKYSKIKKN